MKKLAILGASYLQIPLIKKANDMGLETHVFAWQDGAVGKDLASCFYPLSVLDKELILLKCKEIGIDGITTIATDIAMPTVNYIAKQLNLIGNSLNATLVSTDKYEMRKVLSLKGIPCPRFSFYETDNFQNHEGLKFPLIVKPTDRSGSRGVTKVNCVDEVNPAIKKALDNSVYKRVIVEEFIKGKNEFSVECISCKGEIYPLVVTDKVTTGAPYFCELEHHQPALISDELKTRIFQLTIDSINALGLENGASHTEVILDETDNLHIVEVAGRMGGDFIGSHLVELSTGFDFLQATVDVSLGDFDFLKYFKPRKKEYSGVYFLSGQKGEIIKIVDNSEEFSEVVFKQELKKVGDFVDGIVDQSDKRIGLVVYSSNISNPIINPHQVLNIVINSND
jgi:biotin carboxylase